MQQPPLTEPSRGCGVPPAPRAPPTPHRLGSALGGVPLFPQAFALGFGVVCFGFLFPPYFWVFLASPARGEPGGSGGFRGVGEGDADARRASGSGMDPQLGKGPPSTPGVTQPLSDFPCLLGNRG